MPRLGEARFKRCVSPPENLDGLSPSQLKELVANLLDKMAELERTNAEQREEIARLKGLKGRPDVKPSGMDKATEPPRPGIQGKRPGRGKVRPRVVVETNGPKGVQTVIVDAQNGQIVGGHPGGEAD